MYISNIKPYSQNSYSKPSFCADKLDKREFIENLIAQRNGLETTFCIDGYDKDYLCHAKNTNEIEPVKRIRKALFAKKILIPTKEMLFLDRLISKSTIPQDVTLFRCCTPFDFGLPITAEEFLDAFFEKGKYFRIPSYPRTTLRKNFAKYYAREVKKCSKEKPLLLKISVPKGAKGLYVDEVKGIIPKVVSQVEEEIILPRNSIFRFSTRSKHSNYEQAEIELVPSFFKVPLFKRIHNFRRESDIPPFEIQKTKCYI